MKRKLNVASSKHWRNLSQNHYTTLGFGDLIVSYCNEFEPGAKVKIGQTCFLRSEQSELPNMGSLAIKNHCFYVPFNDVWKHYNDFMEGNAVHVGAGSSNRRVIFKENPSITSKIFTDIFITPPRIGYELTVISDAHNFDIAWTDAPTAPQYYRFTKHGKQILRLFDELGYNYNFFDGDESHDSALPLLALFKVIYDYYIPANLRPSSNIDKALSMIQELEPDSNGTCVVPISIWELLFSDYLLYYDNNYFTSQWLFPTKPVEGINNFDTLLTNSITSQSDDKDENINAPVKQTNMLIAERSGVTLVSAEQNIMLQSLRKFIMRNNLVGSRPIQRLFARFGVNVPELQLQMARLCGNSTFSIKNYEVTGTSENNLGKIAGQSTVTDDSMKNFTVNVNQFGMVFVLSSIDVPSSPISGIRRRNMHVKPFDYFEPEFANGTLQATSGRELYGRLKIHSLLNTAYLQNTGLRKQDIFGFSERYSEYCQKLPVVSGDYNVPSLNVVIDNFILPRRLFNDIKMMVDAKANGTPSNIKMEDYAYNSALMLSHKLTPVDLLAQSDVVQYNRIFTDISGLADPFKVDFFFKVQVHGNVKPDELSQFVAGEGSVFETEKNGPHLN